LVRRLDRPAAHGQAPQQRRPMIVFDLKCHKSHVFEAWFKDSAAFDRQKKRGLVACTICGSTKVEKAPMAPRISTGKGRDQAAAAEAAAADTPPPAEAAPSPEQMVALANNPEAQKVAVMMRQLAELRQQVEKNCDYVGPKFAEEAKAMHYGEKDKRNIYGEASDAEAKDLVEEGIEFNRVPWVPRGN